MPRRTTTTYCSYSRPNNEDGHKGQNHRHHRHYRHHHRHKHESRPDDSSPVTAEPAAPSERQPVAQSEAQGSLQGETTGQQETYEDGIHSEQRWDAPTEEQRRRRRRKKKQSKPQSNLWPSLRSLCCNIGVSLLSSALDTHQDRASARLRAHKRHKGRKAEPEETAHFRTRRFSEADAATFRPDWAEHQQTGEEMDEAEVESPSRTRDLQETEVKDIPPDSRDEPGEPRRRRREHHQNKPQGGLWPSLRSLFYNIGVPLIISAVESHQSRTAKHQAYDYRHRGRSVESKEITHVRARRYSEADVHTRIPDWVRQTAEAMDEAQEEESSANPPSVPDPPHNIWSIDDPPVTGNVNSTSDERQTADTAPPPENGEEEEATRTRGTSGCDHCHHFIMRINAERLSSLGGQTRRSGRSHHKKSHHHHKSSRPKGWRKTIEIPDTYDSLPLVEWMSSVGWSWKDSGREDWTLEDSVPEGLKLVQIDKSRTLSSLSREAIDDVKSHAWAECVRFYHDAVLGEPSRVKPTSAASRGGEGDAAE
ncbi:hypothetical protein IAR50_005113 [Cryptococcus sp. DSM 104548]